MCLALNAINSSLQSALYNLPLYKHHHQSEVRDSQWTINPIAPQNPPHFTYCMWPPCGHLLLQHATTILHNSFLQLWAKLFLHHSSCQSCFHLFPLTSLLIQSTLLHSSPLSSSMPYIYRNTHSTCPLHLTSPLYHCTLGPHAVPLHDGLQLTLTSECCFCIIFQVDMYVRYVTRKT